jgi:hypothetical protein
MKRALGWTYVFAVAGMLGLANIAAAQDKADDWVPLFNGSDLKGWKQLNGTATYEVKDGMIIGTTAEGSPNSFLCTEKLYGNFDLSFEVKVDDRLNSGVQIRSESKKDYKDGRVHGYQCEIATNGTAGLIYDEARRGKWLNTPDEQELAKSKKAFKNGEWNQYRVVCDGRTIRTWVNGIPISNVEDDMTPTGFIGLQVHSFKGDSPATVMWRNVRIKEIKAAPAPAVQ